MLVEVCVVSSSNRLVTEAGNIKISRMEHERTMLAYCGPHAETAYHRWSVREALGLQPDEDAMEALCHVPLSVSVMLMDKRTNKMAMLYTNSGRRFQACPGHDDILLDRGARKLVLAEKNMSFTFTGILGGGQDDEGNVVVKCVLQIKAPNGAMWGDLHRVIQSLEWV